MRTPKTIYALKISLAESERGEGVSDEEATGGSVLIPQTRRVNSQS